MLTRTAAIDAGNDALKGLFEGGQRLYLPNVITAIGEKRNLFSEESDPLAGLHVSVTSSALGAGKITCAVGRLATDYAENNEMTAGDEKATSDQILVLILTALALDAAAHSQDAAVSVRLSTGLPMREVRNQLRDPFVQRLTGAQHEVWFRDTPHLANRKIQIHIREALVASEGYAAMMHLVTRQTLPDVPLQHSHVLIHDIGGQSTDTAVFRPDLQVDTVHSAGIRLGTSAFLDEIMAGVDNQYGYRLRARSDLTAILTRPTNRNHIYVKGNRTSIQNLVDEALERFAQEEYRQLRKVWQEAPEIQVGILIGGGAALIRPYLEAINQSQERYPLRFLDPEESVWTMAESYDELAQLQFQGV